MATNFPWVLPVRVAQVIFAIIVLGLTAYYISWYSYSDTVNFMLFNGIWTAFVAVPYLAFAPMYFPRVAHILIMVAVEAVTMIFWFAGFIALGVYLPPSEFCHWSRCRALQAATVFGAFDWALFVATTVVATLEAMRSRSNSASTKPGLYASGHVNV
ncbi:hypothetical protein ASPACDRAFT_82024 [Aspergillus aculeatus ATCC 16872]|uniref:MARVEL domain-containing protein n=1 Tax=Aspergillus aculeatus (strain ATCC 16872 / CBS 172.66 / WB 5094) TaxID=690307 RepID=A0A1L9WHC9_ASPA1|nr:uncharacterized protein ASPACDRAFT_82024 [Aspergillus aculeatus ATCC 16872]OJJ95553.1 hypothetical protein ASPACDRAFT_82024 [Aspergillus aculeatus ATCC 16872]